MPPASYEIELHDCNISPYTTVGMTKAPRAGGGALLSRRQASRRQLLVFDAVPALAGGALDDVEPGDFWSGAARSISVVGGCFVVADWPAVDFSVGVALSIAAVGVCLRAFAAAFASCFTAPDASFVMGADCCAAFVWTG